LPSPREWPDSESLVKDLQRCDWNCWFSRSRRGQEQSDLEQVIRKSVGTNTFRSFAHMPHQPSETFRTWASEALQHRGFFTSLLATQDQRSYDAWLADLAQDFCRHWKRRMECAMPFGPGRKLPNLLVKNPLLFPRRPNLGGRQVSLAITCAFGQVQHSCDSQLPA
jgi:hypothetical protein